MTKRQAIAAAVAGATLLVLGVVSAFLEPPEPEQICLQAQNRLVECRDELTRPRVLIFARRKQQEALDTCEGSEPTVDMYENCLAKPDCKAFAECIEAYATEPVTPVATAPGRR